MCVHYMSCTRERTLLKKVYTHKSIAVYVMMCKVYTCNGLCWHLSLLTEFYGIELWVLKRAIQSLAREGKAELIPGESADGSDAGVKFFS